ncbi:MAG TPA: hypothetical protein P5556_06890 [Candidatus Gastranaerophilales bacterium]|nr:hypothetical protein [Candidatus Gastranaerophilales bacterium]
MKKYLTNLIIKEKNVIFIALGISLCIFGIYLCAPNKTIYRSSAKIFIKDIPQYNVVANFEETPLIKSESGYSNPLFNFAEVLGSKNISTRVLSALKQQNSKDLAKLNIKNEDEWHNYYEKLIKTKIIPSTDTLAISLKWINKESADEVLGEVIKQFKAENIKMRKAVAVKQKEYLEQNLTQISNDLSKVSQEIRNYTVANNIVDVDMERSTLVRTRVELERDAEVLKSRISYYNRKYNELSSQIGIADVPTALRSTSIASDPYLNDLFTNLAVTQQKYANLSGTFTDNYPSVISAKNEIKTLSKIIDNRKKDSFQEIPVSRGIYDEPSQDIVAEMANAKAEKISLLSQLKEMQRGIKNLVKRENTLPEKIAGLEELQKQEDALKAAYNSIKSKVIDAQIKETETVDNIIVLNNPSEANLELSGILINLIGLVYLGLVAGILAAWLKDSMSGQELADNKSLLMERINPARHFNGNEMIDEENLSVKEPF